MNLIPSAPRVFAAVLLIAKLLICAALRAEDPDPVNASVLTGGCSGVIVQKGEKWAGGVTAAHCFLGNVGGKFTVWDRQGNHVQATLLSVDRSVDLARFAVPANFVRGVSPVAIGLPDKARYEALGWPGNQNPRKQFYFLLRPNETPVVKIQGEQFDHFYTKQGGPKYWKSWDHTLPFPGLPWRWSFHADNGGIVPGMSGCGVFSNGQLVGICANNPTNSTLVCSTPDQLIQFMKESDAHGCAAWNLGDWSAPALDFADAPPAIGTERKSNKPLRISFVTEVSAPQSRPTPPPPDAGHDESAPPPEGEAPKRGSKQRLPKDLKGNCNQGRELLAGRERDAENAQHDSSQDDALSQLTARVDALEGRPAERVVEKEKPAIPAVEKPNGPPILLVLVALCAAGISFITMFLTVAAIWKVSSVAIAWFRK